jgi:hypothetical protein
VHVPARARVGRVDVRVRIDPEHAPAAVNRGKAPERAECDRVVAAEDEGQRPGGRLLDHLRRYARTRLFDLGEEACSLVVHGRGLGHGRLDVAVVPNHMSETDESLLQPGVANRRRPHVDAAAPLTEVERCTDDGDLTSRGHGGNLTTLSRRGEVAQLVEHTAENRGVAGSSPALAITGGRDVARRRARRPEAGSREARADTPSRRRS